MLPILHSSLLIFLRKLALDFERVSTVARHPKHKLPTRYGILQPLGRIVSLMEVLSDKLIARLAGPKIDKPVVIVLSFRETDEVAYRNSPRNVRTIEYSYVHDSSIWILPRGVLHQLSGDVLLREVLQWMPL